MQNLKTVLQETKNDEVHAMPSTPEDRSPTLIPGVNFIHGDIFDVVSTVRMFVQ
jgi:hypothetical protein